MTTTRTRDCDQILHFWFGELDQLGMTREPRGKLWFMSTPEQDSEITEQFGALVSEALTGGLTDWELSADSRLALIILLDQLTRNIYRRQATAFSGDTRAVALCREGIAQGHDQQLPLIQRAFFYLPLVHAEDAECHRDGLELLTQLYQQAPKAAAGMLKGFADSAAEHKQIIDRFGRYPYRNAVLGRENTLEEQAWLDSPDKKSFGQG